MLNEN